jgi:hypothetical protein
VAGQLSLPENAGLDHWQVAGREAKRDLDIWSTVFAGQESRLVRVAAGWAAVDWVTNRIAESMAGSFDAIAIAPYITPTDAQRESSSAATTVDRVLADTRANIAASVEWVTAHDRLAREWSERLGRGIGLVAYEGGPHLDGRGAAYQAAFHAATNDPRMGDIYRDYLRAVDAAGLDLYVDFQFTGADGAAPWGDFAKLHRMDEPLATAYRYNAVVAAANGSLWNTTPSPPPVISLPVISISAAAIAEGNAGRRPMVFTVSLSQASTRPVTVRWGMANGTATAGRDYVATAGSLTFAPGQTRRTITALVIGDRTAEADEAFRVGLASPVNAMLSTTATRGTGTIRNDDGPGRLAAVFAAIASPPPPSTVAKTRR